VRLCRDWCVSRGRTTLPAGQPAEPIESATLSVYRDQTGGDPVWHEMQNVTVDREGNYTVLLGSTLNEGMPVELFAAGESRWLGVRFNRPGEDEQARVLLVSVPYALKAADAERWAGSRHRPTCWRARPRARLGGLQQRQR
jgi:hypothetical protein